MRYRHPWIDPIDAESNPNHFDSIGNKAVSFVARSKKDIGCGDEVSKISLFFFCGVAMCAESVVR